MPVGIRAPDHRGHAVQGFGVKAEIIKQGVKGALCPGG